MLEMSKFIHKNLLTFININPNENSIYNIYDPLGIKLLHRLRLGFSHLREHNSGIILQTPRTHYAHVIQKLKARNIILYAATIMPPFAQTL